MDKKKRWAQAQHEHRDPRAIHPEVHSERDPKPQNYGQAKNRSAGRMNSMVNWFRRAPR